MVIFTSISPPAHAGLYYSGETYAELPAQWRGFLLDQRQLRQIAQKPAAKQPASPARERYQGEADRLEKLARERALTADEQADLGALYLRLGDSAKAVEILRAAQRRHPEHFAIVANLGTAWQLQGDYEQAITCLEQALRLAPAKFRPAEECQLRLVRQRQRQPRNVQDLDDLFGVRYVGDDGAYQPGKMPAGERQKLPVEALALTQQLALWLPADGLLLWQLAELANAFGDIRTAAAILDGCVSEFGMQSPELRRRRQLARAAADDALKKNVAAGAAAKTQHEGHAGLTFRSKRPLASRYDRADLAPIDPAGVNTLPWTVLAETTLDRRFKPAFPKHLEDLAGKRITLKGYMQPLGEDLECTSFMLVEYPVGCWFCEVPDLTGILFVELPPGQTASVTRARVKITGNLSLNPADPENFLYTISKAKVAEED